MDVDEFLTWYEAAWDWSLQYPNLGVYKIEGATGMPSSSVVDRIYTKIVASPRLMRDMGIQSTLDVHGGEDDALNQAINRLPWILEDSLSEAEEMDGRWSEWEAIFQQFDIYSDSWVSANTGSGCVNAGERRDVTRLQHIEYGFTIEVMVENRAEVSATRYPSLNGHVVVEKGVELGLEVGH